MGPKRRTLSVASIALGLGAVLGGSVVAAAGAAADTTNGLSLSVNITSQTPASSACQWTVVFDTTITNSTGHAVTVSDVDAGAYGDAKDYLGQTLRAGDVLQPGANSFTKVSYDADRPPRPAAGRTRPTRRSC